jgi:hypothetical protein
MNKKKFYITINIDKKINFNSKKPVIVVFIKVSIVVFIKVSKESCYK